MEIDHFDPNEINDLSAGLSPHLDLSNKGGTKRFCVNFRQLNKVTKSNSWPLPIIDNLLDASYFTSLDLKSGYWQVLVSDEDREKTVFVCQRGLFAVWTM